MQGMAGKSFYAKMEGVDLDTNQPFPSKTITATGPSATSPIFTAQFTPGINPNQSGGPNCRCHSISRADPVATATGMVHETVTDASASSPGIPFGLVRSYRSEAASAGGLLGTGWTRPFDSDIAVAANTDTLT